MNEQTVLIIGKGSMGINYYNLLKSYFKHIVIKHIGYREFMNKKKLILKDFTYKLVIVATPPTSHKRICLMLSKYETIILIEKPLAINASESKSIYDALKKGKASMHVGYNLRYMKSLNYLRELLLKQEIGQLYFFLCQVGQYLPDWRPHTNYKKTVSANQKLGGGVLLELSHEIDYLLWLFGSVNTVYAKVQKQSNLSINVEDSATMVLTFKKNTRFPPLFGTLSMDFIRQDSVRNLIVVGEKGTLSWDGLTYQIKKFNANSKKWKLLKEFKNDLINSYKLQLEYILENKSRHLVPNDSIINSIQVLKVIDCARDSSKKQKISKVKYVELKP